MKRKSTSDIAYFFIKKSGSGETQQSVSSEPNVVVESEDTIGVSEQASQVESEREHDKTEAEHDSDAQTLAASESAVLQDSVEQVAEKEVDNQARQDLANAVLSVPGPTGKAMNVTEPLSI